MDDNFPRPGSFSQQWRGIALFVVVLVIMAAGGMTGLAQHQTTRAAAVGNWPAYLFDNGHSGFNGAETMINPASAPHLKVRWTSHGGGMIFSQPVVANGRVYWGSWDGYERAAYLNGTAIWQHYLGQTTSRCNATPLGVISTATVVSIVINGTLTPVVFVGGGDASLYALNALTGAMIWRTRLGAPASNTFIWDSPVVYNQSIYIGIAGDGDCPVIDGRLFQLNTATGAITHTFTVAPAGCLGGGIWGSPTIDQANNALYFTTGNASKSCHTSARKAIALVKVRAADLSYLSSWQVPASERGDDSDFGSTPTLFHAKIGGILHQLVGVANKNGTYYAFDRTHVNSGPIWRAQIAVGGPCPECGQGSISSSAWDGTTLYVAGGTTTMHGTRCQGSLRALKPVDGSFTWQHCLADGPVLGGVTAVPGVVAVVEGPTLVLVDATSGRTLFTSPGTSTERFYGSPSISNGVLYLGNQNGDLYAFET